MVPSRSATTTARGMASSTRSMRPSARAAADSPFRATAVTVPSRRRGGRASKYSPPVDSQPHDGAVRVTAHLHQITELMGEPETASAWGVDRWADATDERIGGVGVVGGPPPDCLAVDPGAERAAASPVADAVRRDLVHCEHEVVGASGAQPDVARELGDL